MAAQDRRDFFISFNGADLPYADAIDGAVRAAGFTTYFHPEDVAIGENILTWMDHAIQNSGQMLALYSPNYTSDRAKYSKAERYAVLWQDPAGDNGKLILILLADTEITPLFQPLKRIDIRGSLPADGATVVVEELNSATERKRRDFWRTGTPLPKIFRAGYAPNANFSGRLETLEVLHATLRHRRGQAIVGMGGVGKTTLVSEYCHRFGGQYAGVWWIRAEQEAVMLSDLANLGRALGVSKNEDIDADARAALQYVAGQIQPWLLVYDNAPNADLVQRWLPLGATRHIVTSRFTDFEGVSPVAELTTWSPTVTTDYFLSRTKRDDIVGASRLAERLDGLPLAAEQASAYLSNRQGISFDSYRYEIERLIRLPRSIGIRGEYPDTVYAAFVNSLEAVSETSSGPIAVSILKLCAFLSADGVDVRLLAVSWGHEVLPPVFASAMLDEFAREDALAALSMFSLMHRAPSPNDHLLLFHRLLLDVVRHWMGEADSEIWGELAAQLVSGSFPKSVASSPAVWMTCEQLLPHVVALDEHSPRTVTALKALDQLFHQASIYLHTRGDDAGALYMAEKSVGLARLSSNEQPVGLGKSLDALGMAFRRVGKRAEAEASARESLALKQATLPPNHPDIANTLSNLGDFLGDEQRFEEGEPLLLRAAKINKEAHSEWSWEYAVVINTMAKFYGSWSEQPGQRVKGLLEEEYATKALAIARVVNGIRHPSTMKAYVNFATMGGRRDDASAAAAAMERATAIALSLGLSRDSRLYIVSLLSFWRYVAPGKASAITNGDVSILFPAIREVESEHQLWVAESPLTRKFGPPGFFDRGP